MYVDNYDSDDEPDWDNPNLAGVVVVKDRDKDVKIEFTPWNQEFDEYFEYKDDDYLVKYRYVPHEVHRLDIPNR